MFVISGNFLIEPSPPVVCFALTFINEMKNLTWLLFLEIKSRLSSFLKNYLPNRPNRRTNMSTLLSIRVLCRSDLFGMRYWLNMPAVCTKSHCCFFLLSWWDLFVMWWYINSVHDMQYRKGPMRVDPCVIMNVSGWFEQRNICNTQCGTCNVEIFYVTCAGITVREASRQLTIFSTLESAKKGRRCHLGEFEDK